MAALGTFTQPATITVTVGDSTVELGAGDIDFPLTATPCDSTPGTAGYALGVDVKAGLARLLRDAADRLDED
ncbi:hypothetical protein SEA_KENNA_95 [Gordonia phage Kenna]|uniref:Uncharacterized protein n=2 Tax=Getalongvirus kenna TaxID=2734201 RepID=A0A3S9UPZ7_9CAUD|nr:hypothetical protein HOU97_gp95 [Gordonia phage Kenna]AZS12371.1 hypothetical protein SEA_KENNA_95 [Gordonia phage Kenna]QCG77258.1 hypothetical protein SEA_LUTUM_101 [Gordonia phage Lutum]